LEKKLLRDFALRPGEVYRHSAVEDVFTRNRTALPPGAKAEDQTSRTIDERKHTISLVFDFTACNPRCD
jgi:hypothetical protein